MPDTELTTVYIANGQPEAEIIKGRLEAEGIPAMLRYESVGLIYGFTFDGLGQVKIQVPASVAKEARGILEADNTDGLKSSDQVENKES